MASETYSQNDLFQTPKFEPLHALLSGDGCPPIVVIGCGKNKQKNKSNALELYTSERFKTCVAISKALSAECVILSAFHGVISPGTELEPYDLDLSSMSDEERDEWADMVVAKLEEISIGNQITILADKFYCDEIVKCNEARVTPLDILTPLAGIDSSEHQLWLDQALAMALRIQHLSELYKLIEDVRVNNGTFFLSELSSQKLPPRGVYVFLDPSEKNFKGQGGRIVRIGTHAISKGSKSTLRNRLRNHLGTAKGTGNHRGSIFRLHVGRALLEAEGEGAKYPFWGQGQNSTADVRESEVDHERRVSEYLEKLEVLILPIDDMPSKNSMRAHVETQLIALCSEEFQTVDKPTLNWLGLKSPMLPIVRSGLWNLRDVGKSYAPEGQGSVEYILSMRDVLLHE